MSVRVFESFLRVSVFIPEGEGGAGFRKTNTALNRFYVNLCEYNLTCPKLSSEFEIVLEI